MKREIHRNLPCASIDICALVPLRFGISAEAKKLIRVWWCMTSASELFYNRRYRLGRTSDYLGNDSLPDRFLQSDINNRSHHHHLHDFSDGETLRRSTPTRRLFHRLSSTVSLFSNKIFIGLISLKEYRMG